MSGSRRTDTGHGTVRLGLRANAAQFTILVAINALVGGMVGQQQTVLPLLAEDEFGLTGYTFMFTYVVAFGITKAAANYFAGTWSDRYGRKPVLIAGWLFAVPVPLMLIWAPNWGWVVAANVLLGVNQGLCWSMTQTAKSGPRRSTAARGIARRSETSAGTDLATSPSALGRLMRMRRGGSGVWGSLARIPPPATPSHSAWTSICFGFASSRCGRRTVRTPSLYVALMRPASIVEGIVNDRLNEPYARSKRW